MQIVNTLMLILMKMMEKIILMMKQSMPMIGIFAIEVLPILVILVIIREFYWVSWILLLILSLIWFRRTRKTNLFSFIRVLMLVLFLMKIKIKRKIKKPKISELFYSIYIVIFNIYIKYNINCIEFNYFKIYKKN